MYYPNTTYRIQFHREFTFSDLKRVLPYLHKLGIKTIYASPVFSAIAGSVHGYDGIDPNRINPEIGTLKELRHISELLKKLDMGWIQDFVPNHMAYSARNPWVADLMEKGRRSLYRNFFDIKEGEPVMAPFLGSGVDLAIEKQELQVVYEDERFLFRYYEDKFPLNYHAWRMITEQSPSLFTNLQQEFSELEDLEDPAQFSAAWASTKQALTVGIKSTQVRSLLDSVNSDKRLLQAIHEKQFYRLCHWQETNSSINYRRFFTINGLIGVPIEMPEVFEAYHQLLFQLIDEGIIQGVRIDHIDGLYNPGQYLNRLRERVGPDVYIVVEKILEAEESLPAWPVQGTTGYDFLAQLNNLLIDPQGKRRIAKWYDGVLRQEGANYNTLPDMKALILEQYMAGEWQQLADHLYRLVTPENKAQISRKNISRLIRSMLIYCPVYRYYPDEGVMPGLKAMFKDNLDLFVKETSISREALLQVVKILLATDGQGNRSSDLLHFWRKFMQLSGPLMAKGMEDTLMYRHHAYLANNEVGDNSFSAGSSLRDFHRKMLNRQRHYPFTMNTTATHDTKRGEDARARLQLLAHDPAAWLLLAKQILSNKEQHPIPATERYAVLQAVYASLAMSSDDTAYRNRLKQYIQKAAREGKKCSNWETPDEAYEEALYNYAAGLAEPGNKPAALLKEYSRRREPANLMNTLVQLILKCTCPGVADIYQGTELEDLSFVDPDNRRKVDYDIRERMLERISDTNWSLQAIMEEKETQHAKLHVLHQLLQARKQYQVLFERGIYQPVETGSRKIISFMRRYQRYWLLVVLPLDGGAGPGKLRLQLPAGFPAKIKDIFSTEMVERPDDGLLPGVYYAETTVSRRKAGVLLPLFSLPSPYGIGDLGKEACSFARSVARAGQSLWQMLPINPVTVSQSYSPYAAISAFAAEPLYIDLYALYEKGYLTRPELESAKADVQASVNYRRAIEMKSRLLQLAYSRFRSGTDHDGFKRYCIRNHSWLDSYCKFVVLKKVQDGKPWYEWPEVYRSFDTTALVAFEKKYKETLDFERWKQFEFERQWKQLKHYCNALGIQLVGDIPFYMATDSADVWAHQAFFKVTTDGTLKGVAGVPPDYFSDTGQLWGMPVYNWKTLQQDNYSWWMQRLERNTSLFDIVRLDHFRAFYDYWEVKGGAVTAIDGVWKDGPRASLFNLVKSKFPHLPFIAEDLGEIHEGVFRFKEQYKLPGMRILQFGFERYNASLRDLPHNFDFRDIAYTGTHDNNTISGWYKTLDPQARKELENYVGMKISSQHVAQIFMRMLYQSVADRVIVPVQDILSLGAEARINTPATIKGNWKWVFNKGRLSQSQEKYLFDLTQRYNRMSE